MIDDEDEIEVLGLPLPIIIAIIAVLFLLLVITDDSSSGVNFSSTKAKNVFWLLFGGACAGGAALFLYKGARSAWERQCRIFSSALYAASALLCLEVVVTFVLYISN